MAVWWEAGFQRWWNGERLRNILQHFVILCTRTGQRGRNHYGKGEGTGSKRYGKREVEAPRCLPSPLFNKRLILQEVVV